MRILQIVSDTDRRGAQVFATDLAVALRRRGHRLETVALVPGTADGLGVETLTTRWPSLRAVRDLRARMVRFDVTIAHGSTTGPACALAGLGSGRPFVYRQISDSRFWAPTRAKRVRVRVTLARARFVVALSEHNRSELIDWIGVRPERIVVVPNGVPGARFSPASVLQRNDARAALGLAEGPIVLFVGALVPEKGADLAIRSVRRTADAHLVIAGGGPERDRLERLAGELAPGRVHFVGTASDVARLYHAADLLVLPSRGGDAMPAALIEAGLCGLPVVTTRIGAIPEVVVDGVTGDVVSPHDLEGFEGAVAKLLANPSTRATMGEAARDRCLERYDIERVAACWEAALLRVPARA